MEDPQEDPLVVHCFYVFSITALLGDILGVSRSMECDFKPALSYPRFLECMCVILYCFLLGTSHFVV